MQPLDAYATAVVGLPERDEYLKEEILTPTFHMETEGCLTTFYAPFDYINHDARVVLMGITPGWTQTELAFRLARRALAAGRSVDDASREAKHAASFAGPMRTNLVRMLDDLGLPELLSIRSTIELFGSASGLCHMTSAFRYPVFKSGKNYSGSSPSPKSSPLLMRMAREILAPELSSVGQAVIIPLGHAVEDLLSVLEEEGLLRRGRRLAGFPHPSGANGHRVRQFAERRARLQEALRGALGPLPA